MTRGDFWNVFFSLLFVGMTFGMLGLLHDIYGEVPTWIPLFDLTLIVLATFRLTRLFVYDIVTEFFRHWFSGYPKDTFMGTIHALVTCPWCLGLWLAAFVVFFYFLTPFAWFFILFLAIAAVASTLQILANLIGWSAEYRKLKTKQKEADMHSGH